jgi:hypothetical protein
MDHCGHHLPSRLNWMKENGIGFLSMKFRSLRAAMENCCLFRPDEAEIRYHYCKIPYVEPHK